MSRILVIDREPRPLCELLEPLGHEIVVFLQPNEGLACLQQEQFDVIFLAIKGLESDFLQTLREDSKAKNTPVIVLSEAVEEAQVDVYLAAGALDYLPIPVAMPMLECKLAMALRVGQTLGCLEEQLEDLAQKNYLLEGQRVQMEHTLGQLRQRQAQHIERAKMAALADLVVGVAHEINTPLGNTLTTISHLCEGSQDAERALRAGKLKRSQLRDFLESCVRGHEVSLRSLERTVALVENFKRISVNPSCEERRTVNLKSYITEVVSSYGGKLRDLGHHVEVQGDDDLNFKSYPGLLAQVFGHLLSNSITHGYTPGTKGQLLFTLVRLPHHFQVRYADDGVGIPAEHISRVFDPFFTTLRGGGSGLGLHITYNLITHALEGKIRCRSEAGKGSTFIIDLPVAEK